jgi:hypothetical protein
MAFGGNNGGVSLGLTYALSHASGQSAWLKTALFPFDQAAYGPYLG